MLVFAGRLADAGIDTGRSCAMLSRWRARPRMSRLSGRLHARSLLDGWEPRLNQVFKAYRWLADFRNIR